MFFLFSSTEGRVLSLTEIASREVAASIPFELVEHYFPPVPEELQLRIAFWSFPEQVTNPFPGTKNIICRGPLIVKAKFFGELCLFIFKLCVCPMNRYGI